VRTAVLSEYKKPPCLKFELGSVKSRRNLVLFMGLPSFLCDLAILLYQRASLFLV